MGTNSTRTMTICCAAFCFAKYGPCTAWTVSFSRHRRKNDTGQAAHGPSFVGHNAAQYIFMVLVFPVPIYILNLFSCPLSRGVRGLLRIVIFFTAFIENCRDPQKQTPRSSSSLHTGPSCLGSSLGPPVSRLSASENTVKEGKARRETESRRDERETRRRQRDE